MSERADRLIKRKLGEAVETPAMAEALLAKYHYLPDPRRRSAEEGWYAHEHGHKALVVPDATFGNRWQIHLLGEGEKYNVRTGTGLIGLETALMAAHTPVFP